MQNQLKKNVEPALPTPTRRVASERLEKQPMRPADSTARPPINTSGTDHGITLQDDQLDSHSTAAQASRLLQALRIGPVSSIAAAQDLDIVHPPSTIRHLRKQGWGILTHWCYEAAAPGRRPHRVGLYVLASENQ